MLSSRSWLFAVTIMLLCQPMWGQDRSSSRSGRSEDSQNQGSDSAWKEAFKSNDHNQGSQNSGPQSQDQDLSEQTQQFISRYDSNKDGKLSKSELPDKLKDGFDKIDSNGDGNLDSNELKAHAQRMMQAEIPTEVMFVWIEGANNGRMHLHDLQSAYDMLRKLDENGDGHISRDELRDRRKKVVTHWINRSFERLDENDDDKISRDEAQNSNLAQRFDRLDEDHDGSLSRSELRDAFTGHTHATASSDNQQQQQQQRK